MARWKLTQAHYLNVSGTEWEYKELNRSTGKQQRKVFPVPLFLNPEDPADWNYPAEEAIIVSNGMNPGLRDHIFDGPPTPDMEPLDDEARAISEAEKHKWVHPIESLSGESYSQSLIKEFERQMAKLDHTPSQGQFNDEVATLKAQISMQGQQIEQLMKLLSERTTSVPVVNGDTVSQSVPARRM
jgi:hypothetical protein